MAKESNIIQQFLKQSFVNPLREFIHDSRAIGVVLLGCTVISLVIANLFSPGYVDFWYREFHFFEALHLPHSTIHWINDGFMAIFFFLVGMEIKREMVEGELSSVKKSMLPIFAAVGGMLAPAVIYALFTKGTPYIAGWGIPTATDIAFAIGIASLVGKKAPVGLKIFLTALAIIDDLGAILVIALFYGGAVKLIFLLLSAVVVGLILYLNKRRSGFGAVQVILGLLLWYFMFNSGIHATIAGVIFAFLVPNHLLQKFEQKFHVPVYFIIMPVFALANTAIVIPEGGLALLNEPVSWGIMLGLFLGKPLGIVTASFLLVKNNLAELPRNTNWYQMIGAGILAGIGFTMSIFIATLAFGDKLHQDTSKIAVLLASFLAMITGFIWFKMSKSTAGFVEETDDTAYAKEIEH